MNLISLLPTSNCSIANVLLAWKHKWKPSEMVMLSVHSDVGWHTNIKKRLAQKKRRKGRVSRVLFLLATQFFSSLQFLLVCIPQSSAGLLGHKRPDSHGSICPSCFCAVKAAWTTLHMQSAKRVSWMLLMYSHISSTAWPSVSCVTLYHESSNIVPQIFQKQYILCN